MISKLSLGAIPLLVLAVSSWSQTPAVTDGFAVGEPPPPLALATWVLGEPVELAALAGTNVCLVEFWATWCPPCLLDLHRRAAPDSPFADPGLVRIAVTEERPATVRAALGAYTAGDLGVRVVCDDAGKTTAAWVESAGVSALPYAVLVDRDGRVAWRGDPRGELDRVLPLVLAETWDLEAARVRYGGNVAALAEHAAELDAGRRTRDAGRLLDAAFAAAELDLAEDDALRRGELLNGGAWSLLTDEGWAGEHTGEALALARRADADTGGEDPKVLDTLARAQFDNGEAEEAVRTQRRALARLGGPDAAGEFAANLARYEAALPDGSPLFVAEEASAAALRSHHDPLTRAEAAADLEYLREYLSLHYAGYDDLEWKLLCAGSSWAERTRDFAARLETKESWPVAEVGALVREYLALVQDSHFWMQVPGEGRHYLVSGLAPHFTDLRLRRDGARFVVIPSEEGPSNLEGRALVGVEVVTIERARAGVPYLFPTPAADPAHEEFLLGRFDTDDGAAPLAATFHGGDGGAPEVSLPLHRGRSRWTGEPLPWEDTKDQRPWSLREVPDAPWPLLAVRTMVTSMLPAGLDGTARTLRDEPLVILDLRGNGGGADTTAYDWCGNFSRQRYRNCAAAGLARGTAHGRGRWTCHRNSEFTFTEDGQVIPYAGRLLILIDRGVASSGETFVRFASQIPGAVLVGENTMGCVTYGNCSIVEPLPASGITVRFGYTKFVENTVVPVREGVGFFPDFWLDEPDVFAGVARLLCE